LFVAAIGRKELPRALDRLIMPRPAFHRASKLRDRSADDDTDINRAGGWSRERLERMDAKFVTALERELTARRSQTSRPPRQTRR
jgi:hypothetical protein